MVEIRMKYETSQKKLSEKDLELVSLNERYAMLEKDLENKQNQYD